ncbi:unnamed protein product [Withania somnifera]
MVKTDWLLEVTEGRKERILEGSSYELAYSAMDCRRHSASIKDFGGVVDGKTLNTKAFQKAVTQLRKYASDGGAQLVIPAGHWLTGSFNLTSHFTLFLHKDAVLFASQQINQWPAIDPLPSYGHRRDAPGGRYISLIFGTNLTDVIITSNYNNKLKYTRPYLIELMHSNNIQISNLTLVNSPSWNIHPVYSSNIIIQDVTILAPVTSPNTDGTNADLIFFFSKGSCTNIRLEDNYIVSGDDCVPTNHLIIRRLTCISPYSAAIALGSEMSGGIQDVRIQDTIAIRTESRIRIKTAVGRGGFVKDVYATMAHMLTLTGILKPYQIKRINYQDVVAENVSMAGQLEGISGDSFTGICMSNVTIGLAKKSKKNPWACTNIEGISSSVQPPPCKLLADQGPKKSRMCHFPTESLPIDNMEMQRCSYRLNY